MRSQKRHSRSSRKSDACTGKDKLTKEQAIQRRKALERKDGLRRNAYKCKHGCRIGEAVAWHVGHKKVYKQPYKKY